MFILPQLSSLLFCLWQQRLISGPQEKLVLHLLQLWPAIRGRYNLTNLSRYSSYHEQSFRRHFAKAFPWATLNTALIQSAVAPDHELMLAQDASFVRKSGKKTQGLGHFYNGCSGRAERGLELSLVSVVDLTQNTAYALQAKQSLPKAKAKAKAEAEAEAECPHLQHLRETQPFWPAGVKYLAVDGAYARRTFVQGACALGLEVISRLRCDANMRTLYTGEQKARGRERLYGQKVDWNQLDLSQWRDEGELEPGVRLYSRVLNHVSIGRNLKVALVIHSGAKASAKASAKARYILLFCTDLSCSGRDIVRRYRARFGIEFLFRDAKSGAGLLHCQSRSASALDFAWNLSFAALNVAKLSPQSLGAPAFSWASIQQTQGNTHLLQLFCSKLDLDWSCIQSHPNFHSLVNYGSIHA